MNAELSVRSIVEKAFADAGVKPLSVSVRSFPGEVIAVVEVDRDYQLALSIASQTKIENGFVTIRQVESKKSSGGSVKNVADGRVTDLLELLNARSRASESQPSLRFIGNVDERLNLAVSPRHQLIFGRRGVGKTSLLLEAKRVLEQRGAFVLWVNMHPLRTLTATRAFLTIMLRVCDLSHGTSRTGIPSQQGAQLLRQARDSIEQALFATDGSDVAAFVPLLQQAIARFCIEGHQKIFIFLDDIHYLKPSEVPILLDLLHGITRDNPVWLKVAGIQHQTRWFVPSPPTGLQTGHDAVILNLDVTLEHPERAKNFLQEVLKGYLEESGALPISAVISREAIDRLVLASGGVPRDFLTLCASSIQTARLRAKASAVGVQDVNNAAGIIGQTKLQELEDDAAATSGRSAILVEALTRIRHFLLDEQRITFFRVDFRDKEVRQDEYRQLQALADMRMLHLINASLSDPQHAGQRSEVYLLDLSQYSGSRLKQRIKVLDFERGHMVLKHTRSSEPSKAGDTPLRLVALLRQGPAFPLAALTADASGHTLL